MKGRNGLILAGGKSERMGLDKAQIDYHGLPQFKYLNKMLMPYCDDVFLSSNQIQLAELLVLKDHPRYKGSGPMAGLMTAFDKENTNWLVIAVDYPLITCFEVEALIETRSEMASAIYNQKAECYEPFLGYYKKGFGKILSHYYEKNQRSLQAVLSEIHAAKVLPRLNQNILSANTIEEGQIIKNIITNNGGDSLG